MFVFVVLYIYNNFLCLFSFLIISAKSLDHEMSDELEEERTSMPVSKSQKVAKEHKEQLQRLQEKVLFLLLIFFSLKKFISTND